MFKRLTLLFLVSAMILSLAGCGGEPAAEQKQAPAEDTAAKKAAEPPAPVYDLTKESLTDKADWSSRNVSILGAKIGDVTRTVEKNFGTLVNTRTLPDEYLTIYQDSGLFVFTHKLNGRIKRFEVYEIFAKQIADEKLKKLVSSGDLKFMREAFGPEEKVEENTVDSATEYVYDAKGFRFVQYNVNNRKLNALRFSEMRKGTT